MATPKICSIPDCAKRIYARGLCNAHYRRFMRYGDPLAGRAFEGEPERYVRDVALPYIDVLACLPWPYAKDRGGYGVIVIDGVNVGTHRFVCREAHGEPPSPEHEAAHSCGNRICCNPQHLRWATVVDNHADKRLHGTDQRGTSNPRAKLTDDDVRTIRANPDRSGPDLAKQFGVTKEMIYYIRRGLNWTHI